MNATYFRTVCRQLLLKATPKASILTFDGSCRKSCYFPLQCVKIKGIVSPEVCALPTTGMGLWMVLTAVAALLLLAGIVGWTVSSWCGRKCWHGKTEQKKESVQKEELEMDVYQPTPTESTAAKMTTFF